MYRARMPSVAACLAIFGLLLTSCTPTAAPATPKPATSTEPAAGPAASPEAKPAGATPSPKVVAEPRYGGILAIGNTADPPSLDPIREGSAGLFNLVGPAYNGLLQYDPFDNEKIIPDLAERWELSSDSLAYILYLRKDVKWHDGKPFTSADAKFTLDNEPKFYARKRDNIKAVSSVETTGDYSVKVLLSSPSASIPSMIALGNMAMAPKHVMEAKGDMKNDVVGTGPFKLKNYSFGVSLELLKNKDYFIPGRPYLDGITGYIIRDRATLFAAFRTGRIKMPVPIAAFTPSEAKTIKTQLPQAIVEPFQALRAAVFFVNMTQKPWDDVRVRRAISLATDRQAALKAIGDGEGYLGGALIAGQWAIPEDELLKQPGFRQPKDADIAEAKRLLAEAGYATGLQTKILTRAGYADYLKVAEFMTDQLSRIGIRASVEAQESAIYLDRLNRGSYDSMGIAAGPEITDPDSSATYFVKGNRFLISDDKLFELFDKQGRTTDLPERKRIVLEMQYRVLEVAPYVVDVWFKSYMGYWPEVRSYKAGVGMYNNSKFQDVWLAGQ